MLMCVLSLRGCALCAISVCVVDEVILLCSLLLRLLLIFMPFAVYFVVRVVAAGVYAAFHGVVYTDCWC